jgi:hypothetical protein
MHLKKLGILLLVVGGLVALALWQRGLDERSQSEAGAALLPGFDRSRVRAVRVENLERSLTIRIERVHGKEWRIVDPVDFPAELAVVEVLLDALSTQHARPAPDADADKLSLNPPRVIVKVEEDVGGSVLQRQVEIGAIDLGDQWVYARVDGKIFRTERGLDSTLERDLPDWRSRFVLTLSPRQVIEVHRTGSILYSPEDPEEDLTFAALLDGHWTATLPFQAELSDGAIAPAGRGRDVARARLRRRAGAAGGLWPRSGAHPRRAAAGRWQARGAAARERTAGRAVVRRPRGFAERFPRGAGVGARDRSADADPDRARGGEGAAGGGAVV